MASASKAEGKTASKAKSKGKQTPKKGGKASSSTPCVKSAEPIADAAKKPHKGKFSKSAVRRALETAQGSKVVAAQLLGCARSTLDRYVEKFPDLAEVYGDLLAGHIDEIETRVFEKAKKGDMTAALFVLRTLGRNRGYVEARPQATANTVNPVAQKTLEQLRDGKISVSQAAIELEILGQPMPESIRILLAKENPEPPDPSAGKYSVISDEEMERRAAERKEAIQRQKDGLPERRAEIQALRDEASDSFAPEVTGEAPAGGRGNG